MLLLMMISMMLLLLTMSVAIISVVRVRLINDGLLGFYVIVVVDLRVMITVIVMIQRVMRLLLCLMVMSTAVTVGCNHLPLVSSPHGCRRRSTRGKIVSHIKVLGVATVVAVLSIDSLTDHVVQDCLSLEGRNRGNESCLMSREGLLLLLMMGSVVS
jgi:hypothetical protein